MDATSEKGIIEKHATHALAPEPEPVGLLEGEEVALPVPEVDDAGAELGELVVEV